MYALTIPHKVYIKTCFEKSMRVYLTSISLSKFLKQKRIPERSFYRKKKIAELIILDRPRFDSLIKQILKEERTDRINQQILSDRCGTILKQSDFLEKKRLAIAAGKIL